MTTNLNTTRPKLANPWIYFTATFLWTWLFWGIAIVTKASMESGEGIAALAAGRCRPDGYRYYLYLSDPR